MKTSGVVATGKQDRVQSRTSTASIDQREAMNNKSPPLSVN